jgi:hypothetical protein
MTARILTEWTLGEGFEALCAIAEDVDPGRPLESAAEVRALPDRVRAVLAERDAALARVARLERVLAVERGDESAAPPNWWRRNPGHWSGGSAKHVVRGTDGLWWWGPDDPKMCPLEAMEAADAAQEVTT